MLERRSPVEVLADMPEAERGALLASIEPAKLALLLASWRFHARPDQLPPDGAWSFWLLLGGRGSGKSRPASEWVCDYVEAHPKCRIALVGRTAADHRDTIVDGESGIMACARRRGPKHVPTWTPSNRTVKWSNGAIATTFSADEPEQMRGPQYHAAWGDEIGTWDDDAMDMLLMGLRLGKHPQVVFSTTPRPREIIRRLLRDPACVSTRMSTRDNRANLPPDFFAKILRRYEGTSLGRQEIDGELLDEAEGALWARAWIDRERVENAPDLARVVVAVDPTVGTGTSDHDECGVMVGGVTNDGAGYLLADHSLRASPGAWARVAIQAYDEHKADRIVYEANQGGEAIRQLLELVAEAMHREGLRRSASVTIGSVHASRGKYARAEPVAGLSEQGRIHHVGGYSALEDELCNWVQGDPSPNRLDAYVWLWTELMIDNTPTTSGASSGYRQRATGSNVYGA